MAQGFLPVTKKELLETGVSQPDLSMWSEMHM